MRTKGFMSLWRGPKEREKSAFLSFGEPLSFPFSFLSVSGKKAEERKRPPLLLIDEPMLENALMQLKDFLFKKFYFMCIC